jgi:hypothetical protein
VVKDPKETQCPELARWLQRALRHREIVIDLGCGDKWYHKVLGCTFVAVDIWPACRPNLILDIGRQRLPFRDRCFDTALMLDVIEHMDREKGAFALAEAQRVARRVILLTPLKWDDNQANIKRKNSVYFGNVFNLHHSLWGVEDFNKPGWRRVEDVFQPGCAYLGIWEKP